jgi:ATP/maltotriose-dependent transcriptional regulator MalT
MALCEHCGVESPSGFRFCGGCGAPLPDAPVTLRQTRKIVTALFCDVTGSTALGDELDPEVLRQVINRYFAMMRATIERHGGTLEKFIGDAVMAVFGIPVVSEDDALRAVRAAAEIRERLSAVAVNYIHTYRARSILALADGDVDAAETWARSALDFAYQSDLYACRGEANLQLSRVMAERGETAAAANAARAALEIYHRKADRPRAEQARARLDALDA